MTRYKFFGIILSLVCILTVIMSFTIVVGAVSEVKYINSENNYKVILIDEADLLTPDEEAKLVEDMKPVTDYGNIAFWTTTDDAYNEIEQARVKRNELFDFESGCIFVINMNIRKLTIQSYGKINEFVDDSKARSITDNVSTYATSKKYYDCAKEAFSQINTVCKNSYISEPLKVSGYVVVSAMLGLVIAVSIAFSQKQNSLIFSCDLGKLKPYHVTGGFTGPVTAQYVRQETVHRPPSSSSSGSSCSSCSSCSSGSSCGGGGCGSGGSSSF